MVLAASVRFRIRFETVGLRQQTSVSFRNTLEIAKKWNYYCFVEFNSIFVRIGGRLRVIAPKLIPPTTTVSLTAAAAALIWFSNEDCSIGINSSFVQLQFAPGARAHPMHERIDEIKNQFLVHFFDSNCVLWRLNQESESALIRLRLASRTWFNGPTTTRQQRREYSLNMQLSGNIYMKKPWATIEDLVKNAYSIRLVCSARIKRASINGSCGHRMYHFRFKDSDVQIDTLTIRLNIASFKQHRVFVALPHFVRRSHVLCHDSRWYLCARFADVVFRRQLPPEHFVCIADGLFFSCRCAMQHGLVASSRVGIPHTLNLLSWYCAEERC